MILHELRKHYIIWPAVIWLEYCWYGVKQQLVSQSITFWLSSDPLICWRRSQFYATCTWQRYMYVSGSNGLTLIQRYIKKIVYRFNRAQHSDTYSWVLLENQLAYFLSSVIVTSVYNKKYVKTSILLSKCIQHFDRQKWLINWQERLEMKIRVF